jgi:L-2-hydroxyglutarate oxidase LhgO
MEKVPCVVIGAGAVGLAIARSLSLAGINTLVLERNTTFGAENSSRNSEVLHAGLYYPPGSWKARLCIEGKSAMVKYLKERHIPHDICGKLIVATSEHEVPTLQKIKLNGEKNGVGDLRILSVEEVRAVEPHVAAHVAILSPGTGIFDSHTLMVNYITDIEDSGSSVVYECGVQAIERCEPLIKCI